MYQHMILAKVYLSLKAVKKTYREPQDDFLYFHQMYFL